MKFPPRLLRSLCLLALLTASSPAWAQLHDNSGSTNYVTGSLGIGTTGPRGPLTVMGANNNQFFIQLPSESGTNSGLMLTHSSTGGGVGTYHYSTSGNNSAAAIVNTTNDALHLATNNTPRVTIDQNGNVGIGTTSPAAKLQIQDSSGNGPATSGAASFGGMRIGYTGAMALDFGTQGNASPVYNWIQSRNQGNYSQNYVLAINPNGGNVGIGTTSPQATLDVNGYARLALQSSAPATCSSSNAGTIALNHLAQICVCNGTAWNFDSSGAACSW